MFDFVNHPLVETEWLAVHLGGSKLRVVDARWRGDGSSRDLYKAGHIPDAVHLDWQFDFGYTREGVRDLLLPPDRFAEVMATAGIGDDTAVVAYAETDYSGAARLWWALRYYGHEQVAVLNGGLTKWLAENRPLSTDLPQPAPAVFTPRPQAHWLATAAEIKQVCGGSYANTRLVDTRPPEQYLGQAVWTPRGSLYLPPGQTEVEIGARRPIRAGHIPGAIHWHASTNLDPVEWTYLAPEVLRARAEAAGLQPEQRVITYCGVGISASLGLFALYLAGYRYLALYDASWEEWSTDPSLPVTGPA
ncbi:MAG: sulfurtransferase [Anaerolineae bacterium]|nr:sulfurtransferase [Anaerolineales bacterium]MCQ3972665.1 sulfurtransferase [Anaerolineae bacterium]